MDRRKLLGGVALASLIPASRASAAPTGFADGITVDTSAREFLFAARQAVTAFPVPYVRPETDDTVIALDVMPKGTPAPYGSRGLLAWIDVCDSDVEDGTAVTAAARLGIADDHVEIGGYTSPGATVKPVWLIQNNKTRVVLDDAVYFAVQNPSGGDLLTVEDDGYTRVPGSYGNTTAASANVVMGSDGALRRSTSARRYKTAVKPISKARLAKFKQLDGITYRSACDGDDSRRLNAGVIAEQAHELGLTDLVIYGKGGAVESFAYDRATAYFLEWHKEIEARLDALEAA